MCVCVYKFAIVFTKKKFDQEVNRWTFINRQFSSFPMCQPDCNSANFVYRIFFYLAMCQTRITVDSSQPVEPNVGQFSKLCFTEKLDISNLNSEG